MSSVFYKTKRCILLRGLAEYGRGTMDVSSGWFFGTLQDARRLRSELWEERSAAASAAVVAAGRYQKYRAHLQYFKIS